MTPLAGGWSLIAGTTSAFVIDQLKDVIGLGSAGQGAAFVSAATAFVVDIVVGVVVTLVTQPKPEAELHGLVWSLTPCDTLKHSEEGGDAGWFRKPNVLGIGALLLALILNIIFW
ncbi:hypothetical protein JSCD10_36050 [Clostridioides difficile]|nr:hypothetical protein JSCD10_36050 [Clostridioides difficile]